MADEADDFNLKPLVDARVMYRSFGALLANVLVIALGAFYFGYTLAYISTIPTVEIINKFGIQAYISKASSVQGLLSGIIPIGAGIGALLSSVVNKKFSRRNSIVFTAAVSIVGGVLVLIPNFFLLIIGRSIQGICVGLFSAMVPLFINEFAPLEVSGRLGALNQLLIVSGIVVTNILALFVPSITVPDNIDDAVIDNYPIWSGWWVIFGIPIVIAAVQIILLLTLFRNETPRYLYGAGREDEALELIKSIYKAEYVEEIAREKKAEVEKLQTNNTDSIVTTPDDSETSSKSKKLCIFVAVHLAVLQQMCGVNVVVLYGGGIINKAVQNDVVSKWLQLVLIATQFLACLGTSFVLKKIGRKSLLQLGTGISFIVLTIIGVAFVVMDSNTAQQILVIVSLYVFMISFGFTLGPVVWLYIPEIVPATIVPYTTLSNWAGASITIILFPILGTAIGNNGYLFFIFSVWCLISLGVNHKYVIETMGKTERQIRRDFERLVD